MATQRRKDKEPESTESSTAVKVAKVAASTAVTTFHALNDSSPCYVPGSPYSTIRHTRPWVYYQGVSTMVPISILGSKPLPQDRKITLQKRGWRTGLFGWTVGSWLGGTWNKEVDVTPQHRGNWASDVTGKRKSQYDKEAQEFLESITAPKDHRVLETDLIHIPVASGDGYFRFLIYASPSSHTPIASTASFRIGSLSFSSAQPRGASIITIIPELVLRTGSAVGWTAAWASFYAAFPLLKAAEMLPGTWGNSMYRRAYRLAGGDAYTNDLKERYRLEERAQSAQESVYRNVPFGAAGVRTLYDLEEDARRGHGGVSYSRS